MSYLVHRRQVTIEWGHCDPAGIVYNPRFFEYFDWSTSQLFSQALGLSMAEIQAKYDADMPLVDVQGRFLRPSKFGETVEITTTIGEFRSSSFDIRHQLFNRGELAVEAQETRVWVGRNRDNALQLESKPIPAEVIERLKAA